MTDNGAAVVHHVTLGSRAWEKRFMWTRRFRTRPSRMPCVCLDPVNHEALLVGSCERMCHVIASLCPLSSWEPVDLLARSVYGKDAEMW
jgi:hypothetical protein